MEPSESTIPFAVEKLKGCGVIIRGVDARRATHAQIAGIRQALAENGVIFLEDQQLSAEDQIAFAMRFGEIVINRYFDKHENYPEIAKVEKTAEQTTNIGGGWHTDHSYDQEPAMGSMLLAVTLPETGGDTMFADMYAAYEGFSDEMKARIEGLKGIHESAHIFGRKGKFADGEHEALTANADLPSAIHPLAIRHPDSGKRALYVNPVFTTGIEGMEQGNAQSLLAELFAHAQKPEYVYRHTWRPGSLAFWDNRSTWHFAANDYQGQYRLMHRITLAGGALS